MSHLRRIIALVFTSAIGVAVLAGPAAAVTAGDSQTNVVVNVSATAFDRCC